jgi:hypothetical protein
VTSTSVKPIAFYLPQFHPIPENDAWWGKGFTEWTKVAAARPLFPGHEQPQLPADLGFYDLRLAEVREQQAQLAAEHGIHGFCYYHYWFLGKRLLERPLDEVLASGRPDFPFCLCWANENWSRRWDGLDQDLLMEQRYSAEDDRAHIDFLCGAFADPRYIRVRDRPIFLVYRPSALPDPQATTELWRRHARRRGVGEPYLVAIESFESEKLDWRDRGFDGTAEFQPDWWHLGRPEPLAEVFANQEFPGRDELVASPLQFFHYPKVVQRMQQRPLAAWPRIPAVMPRWDNTARRGTGGLLLHGSTPELFGGWVREAVTRRLHPDPEVPILLVNSWNEWAEGAQLEPCQRWGDAYLQALGQGVRRA